MKKTQTLSFKIILQVVIMALVLILIAVLTSYIVHSRFVDNYYRDLASNIGRTTALQIDTEAVQKLIDNASDPEFLAASEEALEAEDEDMLASWLDEHDLYDTYMSVSDELEEIRMNMGVEYLYIQRNEGATSLYLIDPSEGVLLYGLRAENNPEFAQYTANEHIDPTISNGEYGWLCSGYEPLIDKDGNAIALVGVDISMTDVMAQRQSFLVRLILFMAVASLITVVIMLVLIRKSVISPIKRLAKITRSFVQDNYSGEESFAADLSIDSKDEIGELYASVEKMHQDIQDYMINLTLVTKEKERIGAELNVATKIQADMLPSIFPAYPDRKEFDIYASMTPAKEVGGDFYDFFMVDDDHLAMVIGDVSGKGVPAALFMVISKTLLQDRAQMASSPKLVLETVNNILCGNNTTGLFVTVWFGIMEISTGKVVAANAGHEFPAIRKADGNFELLKDRHGFVLAGMEGSRYKEYEFTVEEGGTLIVYTDGVAEATDSHNELFGTDRMLEALNIEPQATPKELNDNLLNGINTFVGRAPQFDDITIMCVKRNKCSEAPEVQSEQ